jgi:hypothetical protein
MGERFSDGAVIQHMSKLRSKMMENNLKVPPPLRRGNTNAPSRIYASSATSRRASVAQTPTIPAPLARPITTTSSQRAKKAAGKKRSRRTGLESDSDSQLDDQDMDLVDTDDGEYGASTKKKKGQSNALRPSKKLALQKPPEMDSGKHEMVRSKQSETSMDKEKAGSEDDIVESVESQGPASRTRGVRPDYAKLEQVSDEDDHRDLEIKQEDKEIKSEDEKMSTGLSQSPKAEVGSDGEVSPRSRAPPSSATPVHLMVEVSPRNLR